MISVGDLLEKKFGSQKAKDAATYSQLFSSWEKVVGNRVASHSKIIELQGNTLIVEADHSSWIQIIQINKNKYLANLKRAFPALAIENISVFYRSPLMQIVEEHKKQESLGSAEEYKEAAEKVLRQTEDEKLKELLLRIEEAFTKRNTNTR